jgi:integrase
MAVKVKQHKGKWWVFIDHKGKRKAKCVGESKRAAQQVAEKIQAKISLGQFELLEEPSTALPFRTYYQTWLDSYVRTHTKDATFANYQTAYRVHLLPFLGETDIRQITRAQLKRFLYEKLNMGLSRNSVKAYLAPLSEMFNHAIEDGHLARNPCLRLLRATRKEKGEKTAKVDVLTREELGLLLQTCQEYFPAYYPFISLLARTGLRVGEAVALQWADIDFHGRFIEVRRSWVDGKLTTTKSSKWRKVDLLLQLTETLKALQLERKKETLRKGWREVPL